MTNNNDNTLENTSSQPVKANAFPLVSTLLTSAKNHPEIPNSLIMAFCIAKLGAPFDVAIARLQTSTPRPSSLSEVWKGSSITFYGNIIKYMLFLGIQPHIKKYVDNITPQNSELAKTAATATFAGLIESAILSPLSTIKAIQNNFGKSVAETWGQLPKNRKIARLYQGTLVGMARGAFYWGPQITIADAFYNALKPFTQDTPSLNSLSAQAAQRVIVGALSGSIACSLSLPFDVISRNMRTFDQNTSFLKTTTDLYKKDGFASLYRGGLTISIRLAFVGALLETVRHQMPRLLDTAEQYASTSNHGFFSNHRAVAVAATSPILEKETGMHYAVENMALGLAP